MTERVDHRGRHLARVREVRAGAADGAERVPYPVGLRELRVLRVRPVGTGLIRVTLGGEDLAGFQTHAADDHVKLILPGPDGVLTLPVRAGLMLSWPRDPRPTTREDTVRRYDAAVGELDLDVAVHAHGLGSDWARALSAGDRVHLAGPPGGHVVPHRYDRYLLAGDLTALPAIDRWLAELPRDARGWALIEVADAGEETDLDPPPGVDVRWCHRGDAEPGTSDVLERAVTGLPPTVPEGERWYCWLAGEAGTLTPLRRWVAANWRPARRDVHIAGYWKRGVEDFDEDGH